jgi:hypothetical protein
MKTINITPILFTLLKDKYATSKEAFKVIEALKKNGSSTEDVFVFINTLTPDYEIELFGDFTGRIHAADKILKSALNDTIEWEKLSVPEMLKLLTLSQGPNGNYFDAMAMEVIKTNKLSVDEMMEMISLRKLDNYCNGSLISIIKTEKLSDLQVLEAVKASSHHWSVTAIAVKTKLFSIDQMFNLWEQSFRDHAVARAIVGTGLASDEDKKTLAGKNSGLLEELMNIN